uniref:Venom redulysin protein 4b n=1 Tax=Pristhesancus plagipennis TaxID=1955184 RepID=A0A1Q1NPD6_PRIPG|nr:venom redulysin protein 4b [Pristhesancus plagipennis]
MSKIWLLLLLVGAIQLVRAFPALEEDEEHDFFELSSFESDDSDEERIKWIKNAWASMKSKMKKVGKKCKEFFKKGKEILKKKGIKIDPLSCTGNTCKSCIDFTMKKRKFCIEALFQSSAIQVSLTKQKAEQEPKAIIGPFSINIGDIPKCKNLGKVLGDICLQGVEGRAKSSKGKPHINFCVAALLKTYGVGAKLCIGVEDGKMKMRFAPKLFAGDEENNTIMEAGDKEDEGRPLDAVPDE